MSEQNVSSTEIETPELAFEREKWIAERAFRERELDLRAKEQREGRSRWSNPLVLAIVGAIFAGLFNAGVAWYNDNATLTAQSANNDANLQLENLKAESARILQAISTGDPDKAATNLKFLLDSGLVANPKTVSFLKNFLATRTSGQGPSLPAAAAAEPGMPTTCGFDATSYTAQELIDRFNGTTIGDSTAQAVDDSIIQKYVNAISNLTTVQLTNKQIQALASLAENIGLGNLKNSSILKYINAGDTQKAADAFLVWDKAGGQPVPGLHLRRLCERDLFLAK